MRKHSNVLPFDQAARYTERDLHLASLIYPLLINLAKSGKVMTYTKLVKAVKAAHPDDVVVTTMLPVQCGRLLGVIYNFAQSRGLPRISALVINKNSGDCGKGISKGHDCDAERTACFAYDWSAALPEFWVFIKTAKAALSAARPVKKLTDAEAREIRWTYFKANRASFIPEITDFSDVILQALLTGVTVEDAFAPYLRLVEVGQQTVLAADASNPRAA